MVQILMKSECLAHLRKDRTIFGRRARKPIQHTGLKGGLALGADRGMEIQTRSKPPPRGVTPLARGGCCR
jgi:hypothetical protein